MLRRQKIPGKDVMERTFQQKRTPWKKAGEPMGLLEIRRAVEQAILRREESREEVSVHRAGNTVMQGTGGHLGYN